MTEPDATSQQNPWFFAIACLPLAFVGGIALVMNDVDMERKEARFAALPVEKSLQRVSECAFTSKRRSSLSCYYASGTHKDTLAESIKDLYMHAGWKLLDDATVMADHPDRGMRTLTFCQGDESVKVAFSGGTEPKVTPVVVTLLEYPACTAA